MVRKGDAFSIGYGYTRTFSPTIVNEFRFAWNRIGVDQDGLTPREEIIAGALHPDVTSGTPTFGLAGFTSVGVAPPGFGNLPLLKSSAVWNFSDNVSMVRGKHTTKFGFDYQLIRTKTSATLAGREASVLTASLLRIRSAGPAPAHRSPTCCSVCPTTSRRERGPRPGSSNRTCTGISRTTGRPPPG